MQTMEKRRWRLKGPEMEGPIARWYAHRRGVLDHPGGYKAQESAVPYLGGTAIVVSTRGRPDIVHSLVKQLGEQTKPPEHIFIIASKAEDVALLDQSQKNFKRFWRQRDGLAIAQQQLFPRIAAEPAELVQHLCFGRHRVLANYLEISYAPLRTI